MATLRMATNMWRRRVLGLVVLAACAASALVSTAAPASAAGTAAPDLTACFAYGDGAVYANKPVELRLQNGSVYRRGSTNASGCGTWVDIPTNSRYYVVAGWSYWVGTVNIGYSGQSGVFFIGRASSYTIPKTSVGGPYQLYP